MQSFLDRWRIPYLVVIAGLTVFFGLKCLELQVDQDNRSMDADNESQSLIEKEFNDLFQSGDPIILAIHKDDVLDATGRALIVKISDEIRALEGVNELHSLADNDFSPHDYQEGLLISRDKNTSGVSILLEHFSDNGESLARLIQEIRAIADANSSTEVQIYVTGLPLQKHEAGRLVLKDQKLFAPLSFLILGAVLLLITRQLSGLVFPLMISGTSIIWTLGIYSSFGYSLNMITSLLPPVIMTLAVMTTIHIYLEWLHGSETNKIQRIVSAVKNLYRPCLFASLTTAIGLLSLISNDTPAVRQFGIFAAVGVMISYFIGVSGLAVGLSFLNAPTQHKGLNKGILDSVLVKLSHLTVSHPLKIMLGTIGVAAVSLYGLQKVRSNTDLLRFLGSDTQLFRDTTFIDQNLTGVNTLELLISKTNQKPFDSFDELKQIETFQQSLDQLPLTKHSLSVVGLIESSGTSLADIPDNIPFESVAKNSAFNNYLSKDLQTLRLCLRTGAIGSAAGAQFIDEIRSIAREQLGSDFEVREAGGFYRVIAESNHLVASQMQSFAIALVLILLAIGIVFRSIKFVGLAIIPNIIPLMMTAA
ncbi:MAG: MMPL family transporter, partial [Verrucomicrobia bacterium]|nr:MMPL family transporter [Verrucomicrobiota bacterium]